MKEIKKEKILKEALKNTEVLRQYQNYKKLTENYGIEEKNIIQYTETLMDLFFNSIEYKSFIVDDEILNDYAFSNDINRGIEETEEYSDKELKDILNKNYYEFFNIEYNNEYEFIFDDLMYNLDLNKKEFDTIFKTFDYSYNSSLYFVFNLEEIEYRTDLSITENIEELLCIVNMKFFNIYFTILNNEDKFKHSSIDLNKDYEKLREKVKIVLYDRIKETKTEIKNIDDRLKNIEKLEKDKETIDNLKEILKKHSIIENSLYGYQERIEKEKSNLLNELDYLIN